MSATNTQVEAFKVLDRKAFLAMSAHERDVYIQSLHDSLWPGICDGVKGILDAQARMKALRDQLAAAETTLSMYDYENEAGELVCPDRSRKGGMSSRSALATFRQGKKASYAAFGLAV